MVNLLLVTTIYTMVVQLKTSQRTLSLSVRVDYQCTEVQSDADTDSNLDHTVANVEDRSV